MRKLILLAAAPLALAAGPAMAQSATGTVTIDGTVGSRCLFTTDNAHISLNEISQGGSTTDAGRLDPARVNGQSATLVGWCNNAAAQMTVEAFPLLNTAGAASGFTNRVDFTATADANSTQGEDTTLTGGAGTAVSVGMFTGNIDVTLSDASAPGNNLLVAGDYDGSVKVTLAPVVAP